ncbi:uncharacterized protein MONOS_1894 [Monocercomonoides exilis]|uniref:uncharacterized protein n=1 Tax=Monocercomonoides exilis TaxID=2049356 RepID=UPI00355A66B3|nr:hypothetical protein MONOS_1894 [Monocercomonoides exilis]|eukprot:MONOS_1894.1-p1 / transcript=MONOS_1894.1 / gene=MONOS_1894 / organism=Monocercomonoides_exilis_PA203 / gene_product=unspecified product / transcript_product=unspecified product / location=Mono_scaffold00036:76296-77354(-) / protein_length=353 / sequence_SO=supercontig / SO=protein_coding / is_pseudo=false
MVIKGYYNSSSSSSQSLFDEFFDHRYKAPFCRVCFESLHSRCCLKSHTFLDLNAASLQQLNKIKAFLTAAPSSAIAVQIGDEMDADMEQELAIREAFGEKEEKIRGKRDNEWQSDGEGEEECSDQNEFNDIFGEEVDDSLVTVQQPPSAISTPFSASRLIKGSESSISGKTIPSFSNNNSNSNTIKEKKSDRKKKWAKAKANLPSAAWNEALLVSNQHTQQSEQHSMQLCDFESQNARLKWTADEAIDNFCRTQNFSNVQKRKEGDIRERDIKEDECNNRSNGANSCNEFSLPISKETSNDQSIPQTTLHSPAPFDNKSLRSSDSSASVHMTSFLYLLSIFLVLILSVLIKR